MASNAKKGWYIGFAVVLGSIGTFIATTDTVFHYKEIFSLKDIDTTKIVRNLKPSDIDSIATSFGPQKITMSQVKRILERLQYKDVCIDSLMRYYHDD